MTTTPSVSPSVRYLCICLLSRFPYSVLFSSSKQQVHR